MPRMPYTAPAAAQAVAFPFSAYEGGGATRDVYGNHTYMRFTDNSDQYATAEFYLPFTPSAVYVEVFVASTGNVYRSIATDFGTWGENYQAHTDSIAFTTVAATANLLTQDDITAAFTGALVGDLVGIRYRRDSTNAADTIGGYCFLGNIVVVP